MVSLYQTPFFCSNMKPYFNKFVLRVTEMVVNEMFKMRFDKCEGRVDSKSNSGIQM